MSVHHRFMRIALSLATRHLGQTWPNPAVGALIVKNGRILGQGWTARGGRPHAETQALAQAGGEARGACLYVTLEPCAHQGKTPPCADAIIRAGIATCVIACRDPDARVNGKGATMLRQAGIEVIDAICQSEAREINRGFFSVIEKKRPYVAVKIASSLDGKIAFSGGEKRWITGERARAFGHMLRSRYDAVATGIGTVLDDDPLLTCRLPGLADCSPVRVLFDRRNRLPAGSQLAQTASQAALWPCALPLPEALAWLSEKGITRLLVEGGQQLTTAFLASGLADRIYWFRAPIIIAEGLAAIGEQGSPHTPWTHRRHHELKPDILEVFECSPA